MERLALDTTFLIDLQNERRARGQARGATEFLRAHLDTVLFLPSVALGEYLEGFVDPEADGAGAFIEPLEVLDVTADVARLYARVARDLRRRGKLIGANDLWIACTARAADLPLVTRNAQHFSRVPGLVVEAYA